MNQEKKKYDEVYSLIVAVLAIILVVDWLFFNGILLPTKENKILFLIGQFFFKLQKALYIIRFAYVGSLFLLFWNLPSIQISKKLSKAGKRNFIILYLVLTPLIILGYKLDFSVYSMFLYPLIFFFHIIATSRVVTSLNNKLDDEKVFGISNKESELCYELKTNSGEVLKIHSPEQGIIVNGGTGAGKTASIITPIIVQAIEKGCAGVVYDFEGDPREPGAPILGRVVYTALKRSKNKDKANFAFINFTDMSKTVRVNPFSDKYISDRMDINNLIKNLMSTLSVNKQGGGKDGFWESYGTAYIYGIAWNLFKNYRKEKLNTLPHLVAIALEDIDTVLRWALQDNECAMIMAPLRSAWNKKADGQLAGAETSGQLPISVLLDPKIFWVFGADEFNLDITNKNNPTMLCIGNSKNLQEALSPAISILMTIFLKTMNSAGKRPALFCLDEYPTAGRLHKLDTFLTTVRKHKVSTVLGFQDDLQTQKEQDKVSAGIVLNACGNTFFGMTNNLDTAKRVSDMLGDIKVKNVSYNTSQDNISTGESMQKEKVMQARDIMSQQKGHFTGKIADGEPPYFSEQFQYFKFDSEEIPSFSYPIVTGDSKLDAEVLDKMVIANYDKILSEAAKLLEKYRQYDSEVGTNKKFGKND